MGTRVSKDFQYWVSGSGNNQKCSALGVSQIVNTLVRRHETHLYILCTARDYAPCYDAQPGTGNSGDSQREDAAFYETIKYQINKAGTVNRLTNRLEIC